MEYTKEQLEEFRLRNDPRVRAVVNAATRRQMPSGLSEEHKQLIRSLEASGGTMYTLRSDTTPKDSNS